MASVSAPTSPVSQQSSTFTTPHKSFDISDSLTEEAIQNEEQEIKQETAKQETLDDLLDQIHDLDLYINSYKDERRRVMERVVNLQYTKEQVIGLTESNLVKQIENGEITVSYGHIHFESYYWLPNFKLLIKAKIPLTCQFLQDHDIESSRNRRNWPLIKEFVTFELFD